MALRLSKKQYIFGGIVLLIVAIGACIALYLVSQSQNSPIRTNDKQDFSTLFPQNKSADDLGGVSLVSPPNASPVYAYADSIGNVGITVSQQEVPASFKNDINKNVEQLAKQDNANRTIKANDITVFIGKSVKGPQSVYFVKNNLLVLIKSQNEISDASWVSYITSLR